MRTVRTPRCSRSSPAPPPPRAAPSPACRGWRQGDPRWRRTCRQHGGASVRCARCAGAGGRASVRFAAGVAAAAPRRCGRPVTPLPGSTSLHPKRTLPSLSWTVILMRSAGTPAATPARRAFSRRVYVVTLFMLCSSCCVARRWPQPAGGSCRLRRSHRPAAALSPCGSLSCWPAPVCAPPVPAPAARRRPRVQA